MRIYLSDQHHRFNEHLKRLRGVPVMSYDPARLTERTSSIELRCERALDRNGLAFLFAYRIFPENILCYHAQWIAEGGEMRARDTIVQQVHIPPMRAFSQKLIFGVRVKEVIDRPEELGFSYETLDGHVEKGISTFTVRRSGSGMLFTIHTLSAPGSALSRMLGPVFSVPYQAYCTRRALMNVKRIAEAPDDTPQK